MGRKMIKTTVIVPVYNTAEYVRECLESIFSQTQKEIEVIAINDGSTDDSQIVLEAIKKEYPELIIVKQENHGLGYTRNVGMDMARGEFVYFIDSDDCLREDALEICYQYAKNNELDVLMFDADVFGDVEDKKQNVYDRSGIIKKQEVVMGGDTFLNEYYNKTYCPSACLVYLSRSFLQNNKIDFLPKVYYEDNVFHCEIMALARRVMYVPQFLYKRRYRRESITMSTFDMRRAKDLLHVTRAISKFGYTNIYLTTQMIARNFLIDLCGRCKQNGLLQDDAFSFELYQVAREMYDVETDSFIKIDLLYRIAMELPTDIVSICEREKIREKRDELLKNMFLMIPFLKENCLVGIYGMGILANRFWDEYERIMGKIRAQVVFIDSYQETKKKTYRGTMVYNIKDIGSLLLEHIVIASMKYEDEMYEKVITLYNDSYNIICLNKDLKFC